MNGNLAIDYNDTNALWHKGIEALTKELGPVGMVHFIRQFGLGYGDYTVDREALLAGVTNESLRRELGA